MKSPIALAVVTVTALFASPIFSADEGGPKPEQNRDRPNPEKDAGPRDGEGGPAAEAKKNGAAGVPANAPDKKTAKIFVTYDSDQDGTVTDEEIVAMMEGKQNSSGKREIRKAVDRADKDNDGVLNFAEFEWWLKIGRLDDRARNR